MCKVVYLTFDDGPEPGITEFVLNELDKYGFKGTFFCVGQNAQKYPELVKEIVGRGNSIGNHTYSHINGFQTSCSEYISDMMRANLYLNAKLFRAPWGSKTICQFIGLRRKFKIVHWSLESGDTNDYNTIQEKYDNLIKCTKAGDIVLFHFSNEHESRTRKLLPMYLMWLNDNDWKSENLK